MSDRRETLKRYRIYGCEDEDEDIGIYANEEPFGDWVKAEDALAEIDRLRAQLRTALLKFRARPAERGNFYAAKPVNDLIDVVELLSEAR
jgi:hypothetical protein